MAVVLAPMTQFSVFSAGVGDGCIDEDVESCHFQKVFLLCLSNWYYSHTR